MVPFFALSKQGSPNYYFFALGALCCAVALTEGDLTQFDESANSRGFLLNSKSSANKS